MDEFSRTKDQSNEPQLKSSLSNDTLGKSKDTLNALL